MSEFNFPFIRRATLFEQVSDEVTRKISDGEWKVGEMLPNENELAQLFQVSPGTIRRALKLLTDKGVLIRRQGRGTFVPRYEDNNHIILERYVRLFPDNDGSLIPIRAEQATFEEIVPPFVIAKALRLPAGEPVIHVLSFHFMETGPVTIDEFFLRKDVFERLTAKNMHCHKEKLLYAFYQNVCGVTIARCEETAKAELLDPELCRRLNLPSPLPVIETRRISYTCDDLPVEYRIQRCITKHYHFKLA